jgi:hypothetical protein
VRRGPHDADLPSKLVYSSGNLEIITKLSEAPLLFLIQIKATNTKSATMLKTKQLEKLILAVDTCMYRKPKKAQPVGHAFVIPYNDGGLQV